ncbi:MAG: OFA family MFS transporter [Ruminococcaceae bacterium]|nr:OFA family MFS transporter [Oscillospiraceae bacterium]
MIKTDNISTRKLLLPIGTVSMLFAGIIYAWSILKAPLANEFGWDAKSLALNFTFTMSFFCIGGFLGSILTKKIGTQLTVILSGGLTGIGFILTSFSSGNIILLYITYALMAGLGIGISYNAIISTVSAWFPDKKGLCSGCLLMGFGASSLLLGKIIEKMFNTESIGWRTTFMVTGIVAGIILIITGFFMKRPDTSIQFPVPEIKRKKIKENFDIKDLSPTEMLKKFSFWRAFICLICLTAVGNSVISFARDLAISVGSEAELATTLVGILAICNGLGRILTGFLFDNVGRKNTMVIANIITIAAAGVILISIVTNSVILCIAGLCITGISYGACPTVSAAFTAAFYGTKYYQTNFSIMNFNLLFASFIATVCSNLMLSSGGYTTPFILLLALSTVALVLNLSIKKP